MTSTTEPLMTQDDPLMTSEAPREEPTVECESSPVQCETENANVSEPTQTSKPKSKRIVVHLPVSVCNEFNAVVEAERRLQPVVLQKALEEFIEANECEPRPYIPPMLKVEPTTDIQPKVDARLLEQIDLRADIEERSRNSLILRAILNYLTNHEGGMD